MKSASRGWLLGGVEGENRAKLITGEVSRKVSKKVIPYIHKKLEHVLFPPPINRKNNLGATASLRFASSKSPTLVQQHKVSYTANGVGVEVLDHMGARADELVYGTR